LDWSTPSGARLAVGRGDGDGGELVLLDDAEADARVGLDLLLQVLGELLVDSVAITVSG
jgi:hypothetical protein